MKTCEGCHLLTRRDEVALCENCFRWYCDECIDDHLCRAKPKAEQE